MHLSLLSSLSLFLLFHLSLSRDIPVEYLYPNFNASEFLYIDNGGVFLTSKNGLFQAALFNPSGQESSFYFSILHQPTATLVWAANRASPISNSGQVTLSSTSLSVSDPNGKILWSTPKFSAPISSMQLLDNGNLRLLDAKNSSLWQSFDHPTDTIISSQSLSVGSYISSSISSSNLSEGNYNLSITSSDAILTWFGSRYWRLSNDIRSIQDNNSPVSSMVLNTTALYLQSSEGSIVFLLSLPQSEFRVLKVGFDGRLTITSYPYVNSSSTTIADFTAPSDSCNLPNICSSLGLCSNSGNSSTCTCPSQFSAAQNRSCVPGDGSSLISSSTCSNSSLNPSKFVKYLSLSSGIGYFSTKFETPTTSGGDISTCQNLCSKNCTCKGFFYDNSSSSCYLLEKNQLGSVYSSSSVSNQNSVGYIKTLVGSIPTPNTKSSSSSTHTVAIVLPSIASVLLIVILSYVAYNWYQKTKRKNKPKISKSSNHLGPQKLSSRHSGFTDPEEDDSDEILIPGLPTRFTFEEIETITNNFQTKIGSGGFGAVFKGELQDKSLVAVKRIEGVGLQGRKEFCTEIAVIGNIRHVNLVRLRGFCAQGSRRLLVYEYMNRGSLERPLFNHVGPILEWGERVEIALGAARGLAYLHNSCDRKIIHCDVKPENILLADGGQVKISDFGLAKLMGPDQSVLFTTMRGTRGYLAPEWLTNAAISDRADVYSFGMVLLELVSGRKNRSETSNNENEAQTSEFSADTIESTRSRVEYFPLLALEKHEGSEYIELADPRLEGRVTNEEVRKMVRIALCCLHEEPGLRPNMGTIVRMIEGTVEVWEPRLESLNFLRLYGNGFGVARTRTGSGLPVIATGGSLTSSSNAVSWSPSYMSSQQVSGPR